MSMDVDLWAAFGFDPAFRPIVMPGYKARRNRNGVPSLQHSRFLGEYGRDGIRSSPDRVVVGALRLARAGRLEQVPEPLRSVVRRLLERAQRNGTQALGAFDASGLQASSVTKSLRDSLFEQASGVLQQAAEAVQQREPEIAEKMAALAPADSLPTATVVDTEKTADQASAEVDALYGAPSGPLREVAAAGVWRTESGQGEGKYDERFWGGDSATAAQTATEEQDTAAKQAGAALKDAAARGLLSQTAVENIRERLSNVTKQGGTVTPELVAQEVVRQEIGQGVTQATGGAPALGPGGSLVGVGLGGPVLGTGPIGGGVGQILQALFGGNQLPAGVRPGAGGLYATPWLRDPSWQHAAGMVDALGSSYTGALLGIGPELQGIRQGIEGTFLDYQTRQRVEREVATREFRREVLRLLWALFDQNQSGGARRY